MLIAIEGIDGAGKRTQTERLAEALNAAGVSACWTAFPRYGETEASAAISQYLNGQFGPIQLIPARMPALLYAEDRFQGRASLQAMDQLHDIIIADRYVASNLAYQGARCQGPTRSAFIEWLSNVEHNVNGMPRADLTVFLDVSVSAAVALVAQKGEREYTDLKADLHEQDLPYLRACREVYLDLCARQYGSHWLLIDCMDADRGLRSIESIHQEVVSKVRASYAK